MYLGGEKMLNIKETAILLKVHTNTINNFVKSGMPSYMVGKNRRFDEKEVIKWFKEKGKV